MSERERPFSSGTQWIDWQDRNCCRCFWAAAIHENDVCEIYDALSEGAIDDGTVSPDIYKRMGGDSGVCTELEVTG